MEFQVKLNSMEDAAKLVNRLEHYEYRAEAVVGSLVLNAKSIMGLLGFGIGQRIRLIIHTGIDEGLKAALNEFMI